MSYRATTRTPIIDTEILIKALEICKLSYTNNNNMIIRVGHNITYELQGSQYMVSYYEDHRDERELVAKIEQIYKREYAQKLELLRLEELRREQERLEKLKLEQKEKLIAQAKKQGYKVKESVKNGKIQLVCVRYA